MRNIKLTLAYDGTEFYGWQIQPGQPTVQGLLTDILHRLTQEQVTIHAAGRTDAGVHAWGQVANFKTESQLAPQELAHGMNALLPPAVRVRAAEEADPDFRRALVRRGQNLPLLDLSWPRRSALPLALHSCTIPFPWISPP